MNNIQSKGLEEIMDWAEQVSFAVTICDCEGFILYMNRCSREVFAARGDLIGKNLKDCHKASSWETIQRLLATGEHNAYTIEKKGQKKLIYQTPWYKNGNIAGLVEISIVLDEGMPHYIRG